MIERKKKSDRQLERAEALSEFRDQYGFWYIIYILANIGTLGTLWLIRGLITYAIYIAHTELNHNKGKK